LQIHWDLKGDTTILSNQTLTIPSGTVLNIGLEILNNNNNGPYIFTNDGTIYNNGTILLFPFKYTRYDGDDGEYNDFINNGNIIGDECINAFDYNNNFPVISFQSIPLLQFNDKIISNTEVMISWNQENVHILKKNVCIYISNTKDVYTFDQSKVIKHSGSSSFTTISTSNLNQHLPHYVWMGIEITTGQIWSPNYRKLTFPIASDFNAEVKLHKGNDGRGFLSWTVPYNFSVEDFLLEYFYIEYSKTPDFSNDKVVRRYRLTDSNNANNFTFVDNISNPIIPEDIIEIVIDTNNNIRKANTIIERLLPDIIYYFRVGILYKNTLNWSTVSQGSWTRIINNMSLLPNNFLNADSNYAQRANGIFYLTPDLDVSVERDLIGSRGWKLTIFRPIVIHRDISWSGTWGGSLILTIDMNWNISLQFKTTDGWRQNNQTIFGNMSIERDYNNEKQTKYSSDVKKVSHNIVKYNYGEQRGGYSAIERKIEIVDSIAMISSEIDITIVSNHIGPILEVRNLAQFINFNAEFVGYYDGFPKRDIAGGDMVIKVFNMIGLRMPTIDMSFKQLLSQSYTYYEINYTTSDRFSKILIDIAECVNIEQKTDGTFNIKLIRPIKITKTVIYNYSTHTMVIQIGTPNSLTWSILTYFESTQETAPNYGGAVVFVYNSSIFTNLAKFVSSNNTNIHINKNDYIFSLNSTYDDFTR
jgi:hypothetical protein